MNERPLSNTEKLFAEIEQISRAAMMGIPVDVDPDVADHMGAFEDNAIDLDEAQASCFDVDPETGLVIELDDKELAQ